MSKRNRWTTYADGPLARWRATPPSSTEGVEPERLIHFMARAIEAGDREHVYRIIQTPDQAPYYTEGKGSIVACLRDFLSRTGELPLFYSGTPTYENLRATTRVAFYDEETRYAKRRLNMQAGCCSGCVHGIRKTYEGLGQSLYWAT
jgi:hypothetical protein